MKIYTKKGDAGTTGLIGGARVSKDDLRVEAYGTIDELSAQTAFLRDHLHGHSGLASYHDSLGEVLEELMRGAALCALDEDANANIKSKLPQIGQLAIGRLENDIDRMTATLPVVHSFTIPGGHPLISLANICRTVCRRAERACVRACATHYIKDEVMIYLNRLSDWLYVLGRVISQYFGVEETCWKPVL